MLTLALVLLATLGPAVVAATAAVWVPTWRQVTLLLLLPVTAGLGLSGLLGMSGWFVALLLIYLSLLLAPLVPFRKRWARVTMSGAVLVTVLGWLVAARFAVEAVTWLAPHLVSSLIGLVVGIAHWRNPRLSVRDRARAASA